MATHVCERCGGAFPRKSNLTSHMNRKSPCKVPTQLIQQQVNQALLNVAPELAVVTAEFREPSVKFHTSISKEDRQDQGIFFTPKKVRDLLFEELAKLGVKPKKILEPSFGTGEFLLDAKRIYPQAEIHGVEKNADLFNSLKLPGTTLVNADFMDWNGIVDLVLGNPPFFVMDAGKSNKEKKIFKQKYAECMTGGRNIYVAFLHKCLKEHLTDDGYLAFILPTSLFNCVYYEPMRKYIAEKTTVHCLKIIAKPGFHDTLQDVVLLILQKKKSHDNFILKTTNGNTYLTPFYKELRELLKGTTTIENLNLGAKTGDVVWNQVKDQLRNEGVLLIYSNNIQNGKLVTGNINAGKEGEKKQYIKENFCRKEPTGDKEPIAVPPLTGKTILVNRGYGNNGNNYSFNFVTVDLQKYYAENHVNVIYPKTTAHADNLKRVEKSFNDERTSLFIKWFVGNGALSARELQCVVPIF